MFINMVCTGVIYMIIKYPIKSPFLHNPVTTKLVNYIISTVLGSNVHSSLIKNVNSNDKLKIIKDVNLLCPPEILLLLLLVKPPFQTSKD